jgi:hypothetical protein
VLALLLVVGLVLWLGGELRAWERSMTAAGERVAAAWPDIVRETHRMDAGAPVGEWRPVYEVIGWGRREDPAFPGCVW